MPQRLCHCFILIAFFLGLIAPACGFSWNGKYSVIEICSAKGIEKKIVLNKNLPEMPPSHVQDDCQFCFNQNNVLADINVNFDARLPTLFITNQNFALHEAIYQKTVSYYHAARGPPSII